MNPRVRHVLLVCFAVTVGVVFCAAVYLPMRAQKRDNARYAEFKRLDAVRKIERTGENYLQRTNARLEGERVIFTKRDLNAT